jgi:hypothetical protein
MLASMAILQVWLVIALSLFQQAYGDTIAGLRRHDVDDIVANITGGPLTSNFTLTYNAAKEVAPWRSGDLMERDDDSDSDSDDSDTDYDTDDEEEIARISANLETTGCNLHGAMTVGDTLAGRWLRPRQEGTAVSPFKETSGPLMSITFPLNSLLTVCS